jgi:hypothetical protein
LLFPAYSPFYILGSAGGGKKNCFTVQPKINSHPGKLF